MNITSQNIKRISFITFIFLLVGCGSAGVKRGGESEAAATLVDTSFSLPVQEFDKKTNLPLAYEIDLNPYTSAKKRIDKEVIQTFIDAKRQLKSKKYDSVISLLDKIIAQDDSLSGPWEMKGDIALIKTNREQALEFYNKAKEVNAKNVNVYIKIAKLLREDGKFILAQNVYADALSIWPDFPEAHLNIGILYDVYLNHPLRAQKHMEAYMFLVEEPEPQAVTWLNEVKSRTGIKESPYQKVVDEAPNE